jgi:allantoinase
VHIVHLSSADALATVRMARDQGVELSAETCPHYLFFRSEEIPDGATEYKCTPPIREGENREQLWESLREGLIDQVVTDHSPSTPSLKCTGSGDFSKAWGGIASLQLGLPAVWTEARARGRTLADVSRWMSDAPSQLAGLSDRKGRIAVGCDADLIAFDPNAEFRVDASRVYHRHKLTPYAGRTLSGTVITTWLRGTKIFEQGRVSDRPSGVWLKGRRG